MNVEKFFQFKARVNNSQEIRKKTPTFYNLEEFRNLEPQSVELVGWSIYPDYDSESIDITKTHP